LSVYADTSFFVSVYINDGHSEDADRLLTSKPRIWFTPLQGAEFAHAISQQVFRGQLPLSESQKIFLQLESDLKSGLWLPVVWPEHVFELCAELARRHGPKLGVRTLDSLHVACALELKAERFWTFDERQAKLAKA
jgi:predicted nucleic acid-binding protein